LRYVTLLLQNDYNIFAITLDGNNKTYLTSDGNADNINTLASWSADGSRIVYTNFKSTDPLTNGGVLLPTGHIWSMNADGSDQRHSPWHSARV
jgi:Tol biopolymer transport system component